MNISKMVYIIPTILVAAAVIPSSAFAQQTDTVQSTTNATSQMTASQNATDGSLAQIFGRSPQEFAATVDIQPGTRVLTLICPPDATDPTQCALFEGRRVQQ